MEVVIDKIIEEVKLFIETPEAEGGVSDILPVQSVYFGDPGYIPVSLFPAITVEPVDDRPTGGSTGFDERELQIAVSFNIDARIFYDSNEDEASGDRMLVRAAFLLRRWLERRSNRTLDGYVSNIEVEEVEYLRYLRGEIVTKTARTTLVATKRYPRTLD
jgi:hypothetical protein